MYNNRRNRKYKLSGSIIARHRKYQKNDYDCIRMLDTCSFGGILADEIEHIK